MGRFKRNKMRRAWFKQFQRRSARSLNTGARSLEVKNDAGEWRHLHEGSRLNISQGGGEINPFGDNGNVVQDPPAFGRYKNKNPLWIEPSFKSPAQTRKETLAKQGKVDMGGVIWQRVIIIKNGLVILYLNYCFKECYFERIDRQRSVTLYSIRYTSRDVAMKRFRQNRIAWNEVLE